MSNLKRTFEMGFTMGIEIGRDQARQELLLVLLEQKFGPGSNRIHSRIERLDEDESRAVVRRLLMARSVKELRL